MSTTIAVIGRGGDEAAVVELATALSQRLREEGGTVLSASFSGRKTLYNVSAPDPAPTEHVRGLEGGTHHYPGRFVASWVVEGGKHGDLVAAVEGFLGQLGEQKAKIDEAIIEGHGLQTWLAGEPVSA